MSRKRMELTFGISSAASVLHTLLMLFFLLSFEAQALPQFTRQYELKCSQCHAAPPMLNSTGRRHLENGYRFYRQEREHKSLGDLFKLDKTVPLGIWLSSRPYENHDGAEHIRAFNDARLYIAGGVYKDLSAFVRVDLEEPKGYRISSKIATLSYNPSELLNLHATWASITFHDSCDTLQSTRQLMLCPNAVVSQSFGGADNNGSLASPRQGIYLTGRLWEHLAYRVGYSGNADDNDFINLSTVSGRLAFEIAPLTGYDSFNLAFGAFGMEGHDKDASSRRFSRIAADAQIDVPLIRGPAPGLIRLQGAYAWAKDDRTTHGSAHNYAWYTQAMFISMAKGSPHWVPGARFDSYTKNGGTDRFSELTLNLTYYFVENFRAQFEYSEQLGVPEHANKDSSTMFQLVYLY